MKYAGAFHAFITNATEQETQKQWLRATVNAMVGHGLLAGKSVTILDVGCGPGANATCVRQALDEHGVTHRILACDENSEHLKAARQAIHRPADKIIEEDIFDPSFDFRKSFEAGAADLVILSHSGYYAPSPAALDDLVGRIDGVLSKKGVLLSLHKADEPTNQVKRHFGAIVESETTEKLHEIFAARQMAHFGNTLEAKLKFPSEGKDLDLERSVLTTQMLSFLGHRDILELENSQIRIYLNMINGLRHPETKEIQTFIQADMIAASRAPAEHRKLLAEINRAVGVTLNPQLPLPFGDRTPSL